MASNEAKKDCMFQYATTSKIYVDTWLITFQEAVELRDKYFDEAKNKLINWDEPQMAIWIDCVSNTNYHNTYKEIDYRDCEVINWEIYKVEIKHTLITK